MGNCCLFGMFRRNSNSTKPQAQARNAELMGNNSGEPKSQPQVSENLGRSSNKELASDPPTIFRKSQDGERSISGIQNSDLESGDSRGYLRGSIMSAIQESSIGITTQA